MANRLKTLFFVIVLGVGVLSGIPLQGGDMKMREKVCPMKCCKKKAESARPKNARNARYICRVLVCSQNMPTNTTAPVQINLAPVIIASEKLALFEILFATTPKEESVPLFIENSQNLQIRPIYIRHNRILI
jgi:hypothetical protein